MHTFEKHFTNTRNWYRRFWLIVSFLCWELVLSPTPRLAAWPPGRLAAAHSRDPPLLKKKRKKSHRLRATAAPGPRQAGDLSIPPVPFTGALGVLSPSAAAAAALVTPRHHVVGWVILTRVFIHSLDACSFALIYSTPTE